MRETDLYEPVKAFLEGQGYEVKGEVGACDVVARRGDSPPVIVELKRSFTLSLVLQGIERQGLSDDVYLAVPPVGGRGRAGHLRGIAGLCRRLGLGLLMVDVATGKVEAVLDPAPYRPRKRKGRRDRLLGEFARRVGDPTAGGATRRVVMTAYRQDALRCAALLARVGPMRAAAIAAAAGVARAGSILLKDHYGWFERVDRGIYRLTPRGAAALTTFADDVAAIEQGPA